MITPRHQTGMHISGPELYHRYLKASREMTNFYLAEVLQPYRYPCRVTGKLIP